MRASPGASWQVPHPRMRESLARPRASCRGATTEQIFPQRRACKAHVPRRTPRAAVSSKQSDSTWRSHTYSSSASCSRTRPSA